MATATVLDTLVVQLTGDNSGYKKMVKQVEAQTKKVTKTISKSFDSSMGRVERSINKTADFVEAKLDRLEKVSRGKFGKMKDAFMGAGQTMTAFVTLPVAAAGVGLIKLAADAETVRTQFETMLGADKGKAMLANLREFSAATPFQFDDIAAASKQLLNANVEQEKMIDTMRKLGDVSAGTGKDLRELAIIYGRVKSETILTTERFNQLSDAAFPVQEIADIMGMDILELKKQMSKGKVGFEVLEQAIDNVTKAGGVYNDMMKKLSETTAGQFSTLIDNIKLVGENFGKILLPIANKVMSVMLKMVKAFDKLDENIKTAILVVGGLVAAIGPLLIAVALVIKAFMFLKSGVITAGMLIIVGKIALVVAAVVNLGMIVKDVARSFLGDEGLAKAFEILGTIGSWAMKLIVFQFKAFIGYMRIMFNITTMFLKMALFGFTLTAKKVLFMARAWARFLNFFGIVSDKSVQFLDKMDEGINNTLGRLKDGVKEDFSDIANTVGGTIDKVTAKAGKQTKTMTQGFKEVGDWIAGIGDKFMNQTKGGPTVKTDFTQATELSKSIDVNALVGSTVSTVEQDSLKEQKNAVGLLKEIATNTSKTKNGLSAEK